MSRRPTSCVRWGCFHSASMHPSRGCCCCIFPTKPDDFVVPPTMPCPPPPVPAWVVDVVARRCAEKEMADRA